MLTMSVVPDLQDICNLIPPLDETLNELNLEKQNITSQELAKMISQLVNLFSSDMKLSLQCVTSLHLTDSVSEINSQLSASMSKIEVDEIFHDSLEFLKNHNRSAIVRGLLGVYQDGEIYEIDDFISDLKADSNLFTDSGFYWNIAVSMSKNSFEERLEKDLSSLGLTSRAVFFVNVETFKEFLQHCNPKTVFERALQNTGNLVIAIGGLNTTYAGPFLILTDLWDLKNINLSKAKDNLYDFNTLKKRTDFFQKVVSSSIIDAFVVPDFFELTLDSSTTDEHQVIPYFDILSAFHALLAISSYAIFDRETDLWSLKIAGSKTIQTQLRLVDNEIILDGEPFSGDTGPLLSLYHSIFDDLSLARVALARRTIALYSSTFREFLLESRRIQISLEAVYNQYLDETVSEILETQQRFAEYLLEWTKKDLELKMELRDIISKTALGGLGSILSVVISLVAQQIQPQAANIALFVVPIAFAIYLGIIIVELGQLSDTISSYTEHHENQLNFYQRILGKEFIQQIAKIESPKKISEHFQSKIRWYQWGLVGLVIISLCLWFYWLANGYFPFQTVNIDSAIISI
jgi:hypothetical protein